MFGELERKKVGLRLVRSGCLCKIIKGDCGVIFRSKDTYHISWQLLYSGLKGKHMGTLYNGGWVVREILRLRYDKV